MTQRREQDDLREYYENWIMMPDLAPDHALHWDHLSDADKTFLKESFGYSRFRLQKAVGRLEREIKQYLKL